MRTKAIVMSALLSLAAGAAMAQSNVYSLNAVGYVNSTFPPGFTIFCNPLQAGTNDLNSLLPYPTFPPGTQVYTFNGSGLVISTMDEFDLAWAPNQTMVPGQAAWIKNNTSGNLTATFVGEVKQGLLTNSLPVGLSLQASQVPQQGTLGPNSVGLPDLGIPGQPGDQVYKWTGSGFIISTFDEFDMVWAPNLTINVGEGVWVKKMASGQWVRNFNVNAP